MSALMDAARRANGPGAPSVRELFPNAIPLGKLEDAVTSGKLWRVKVALNEGADPNEPSALFGTAPHAAARQGHLDIVRLLVEQGAAPARTDSRGRTPAEAAAANGHQPVAEYLRSRV